MNPTTCLFCTSPGPLTKEHIFGEWLRKLGYDGEGTREIIVGTASQQPILQRGGPFSKKLKIACQPCNNVWMSSMEEAAKPLLIDMFNTTGSTRLDEAAQLVMARWAFKTVAVTCQVGRQRLFPGQHCREFHQADRPPAGAQVWIGTASVTRQQLGEQLAEFRYDPKTAHVTHNGQTIIFPAYSARFRLLNVVFDVFGYVTDDCKLDVDLSDDLRRALLPIWPPQFPSVWWPPVASLDAFGGVQGLAAVPLTGIPTFVATAQTPPER
jgi:hypothetical protein